MHEPSMALSTLHVLFMITEIAFIQIIETTRLPSSICLFCYNKLEEFWTFSALVSENQRKLIEKEDFFVSRAVSLTLIDINTENVNKDDSEKEKLSTEETDIPLERLCETKVLENLNLTEEFSDSPPQNDVDDHSSDEIQPKSRFICHHCENSFTKKPSLLHHIRAKHFGTRFSCPSCPKTYKYKTDLNFHLKTVHIDKRQKEECPECKILVFDLQKHIERHKERSLNIRCDICDKRVSNRKCLEIHVKRMHSQNKRIFKCKICQKTFSAQITLKNHLSSHTETFLYSCSYCGKQFRNTGNKSRHVKQLHQKEHLKR